MTEDLLKTSTVANPISAQFGNANQVITITAGVNSGILSVAGSKAFTFNDPQNFTNEIIRVREIICHVNPANGNPDQLTINYSIPREDEFNQIEVYSIVMIDNRPTDSEKGKDIPKRPKKLLIMERS